MDFIKGEKRERSWVLTGWELKLYFAMKKKNCPEDKEARSCSGYRKQHSKDRGSIN